MGHIDRHLDKRPLEHLEALVEQRDKARQQHRVQQSALDQFVTGLVHGMGEDPLDCSLIRNSEGVLVIRVETPEKPEPEPEPEEYELMDEVEREPEPEPEG